MNNSPYHRATDQPALSRRDFLWQSGGGLGGLALTAMLGREPLLAKGVLSGTLHHPPKAKRVIQLFMGGAASHLDTFDFKPALIRHHGEKSDFGEHVEAFQNGLGPWMQSPFAFTRHGQSGKHLSEAVAPLSEVVDDLAFVHNLVGKTGVHSQATYLQATGFQRPGFPGMGSWVSYALGSENENLPTFVVLPDHRGYASNGPKNWASAFLPTHTQGTTIFPQRENPIPDLHPKAGFVTPASHRAGIDLINQLNAGYAETRPGDDRLEARIQTYELAARLQLSATEALDIAKEPDHVLKLYGLEREPKQYPKTINPPEETEYFGRKCLIARRLIERGVRFVQVWSGNDNSHPAATGTAMRISSATTVRSPSAWPAVPPASSATSNNAAYSRTPSSIGPPNSAACRARKAARGVTTIRMYSPTGFVVAVSAEVSPPAKAMNGATNHRTAPTPRKSTTSTPPCSTCSASTTNNSPSATTASTAD